MNSKKLKVVWVILISVSTAMPITLYNQSSLTNRFIKTRLSQSTWGDIAQIEGQSLLLFESEKNISIGERTIQINTDLLGRFNTIQTYPKSYSWNSKLLECYADIDLLPTLFLEAGKKNIKSGTAHFKSPTDFFDLNPDLITRQTATAYDKTREGVFGIGLLYLAQSFSVYHFSSPKLSWIEKDYLQKYVMSKQNYFQNYTKLSFKISSSDIDVIYYGQLSNKSDYTSIFGINWVTLIKERLKIYSDGILKEESNNLQVTENKYQSIIEKKNRWFAQICSGVEFSLNKNFNSILEYYYNGNGCDGNAYENILDYTYNKNMVGDKNAFSVLYSYGLFNFSKHYIMERISYISSNNEFEAAVSNLQNVYDWSGLVNPSLSLTHNRMIKFNLEAGKFYGKGKKELTTHPLNWFLSFNIEYFIL